MKNLGSVTDAAEIRDRIARLQPSDRGRWGVLSVTEMLAHLRAAYVGAVTGVEGPRLNVPLGPGALKFLALRLPVRWRAGTETLPQFKREAMRPPADFSVELAQLGDALSAFLQHADLRHPHPYFGPMRPADWMRWGYLHADHHLRQFGR